MKYIRTPLALTTLVASAGLTLACGAAHDQAASSSPTSITARTTNVERGEIPQTIEIQGTVAASQTAAISVRVMATVTAVLVQNGDRVRSGQLLVEIDPQTTEGQLAQARGALSQARAALALAQRNYERFQALAERNAASDLEVDMARMQFEQASGAVEQAEGAVTAASSVAGDTRVVAPFAGRISQKMVDVGDLAAPGRPLMMIQSESGRHLEVTIPESLVHTTGLTIGDTVHVQVDSRPDLGILDATVAEMAAGADPASHSISAKLDLPVADLATGAAGRAWLQTTMRTAVTIPVDAVIEQGGLSLVVVRTADGRASTRVVTLGHPVSAYRVEVLSGLSGNETVLLGLAAAPPAGTLVETQS